MQQMMTPTMVGGDDIWRRGHGALSDIIAPKTTTPVANPVMFSGDVSFVSKVALIGNVVVPRARRGDRFACAVGGRPRGLDR